MKLINIKKYYHNKNNTIEALKGINLELDEKGITVLLGSSGSGKSTLLNIMSGLDKDFEGQLIDVPYLDYITQDFTLFEAMSVLENLLIVSQDKEKINHYCTMFSMNDVLHQKIKKCSQGQKKRVQFIRALLQSPGLLLCDEPSAALDYENASLLMKQLKQISQEVQVFLVTHDISLANEYADRILIMENGQIIQDQVLHKQPSSTQAKTLSKKSLLDHFKVAFYQIKSRIIENICLIFASLLICIALFTSIQIFTNVDNQTRIKEMWSCSANMIFSRPLEKNQKENMTQGNHTITDNQGNSTTQTNTLSGFYPITYVAYDTYSEADIEKLKQIPDIWAIQAFYDSYVHENDSLQLTEQQKNTYKIGQTYQYNGLKIDTTYEPQYYPLLINKETIDQQVMTEALKGTINLRFFYDEQGNKIELSDPIIHEENPYFDTYLKFVQQKIFFSNQKLKELSFVPYEIVNQVELPLELGQMMQKTNEIVLNHDTAEFIRQQYEYSSIEDLIGQTIEVALPVLSMNSSYDTNKNLFTYHELTISGITPLTNEQKQIFFQEDAIKEIFLQDRLQEKASLYYDAISIMANPNANLEALTLEINQIMPNKENEFILYALANEKEILAYKNPHSFLLYSGIACLSVLLILILFYAFHTKRYQKEQRILINYGYHAWQVIALKNLFIYLFTFFILIFSSPLIQNINETAKKLHYDSFLQYNLIQIFLVVFISYFVHVAIEYFFGRKKL